MSTLAREKALCEFLNDGFSEYDEKTDINDIYAEENNDRTNTYFLTPHGRFLVLTDSEADDLHTEHISDLIDELGIAELFGDNEYIIEKYVNFDFFADWEQECRESYYYDIENESDDLFDNRLQKELFEHKFDEADANEYFGAIDDMNCWQEDIEELDSEIHCLIEDMRKISDEYFYDLAKEKLDELRKRLEFAKNELSKISLNKEITEWFENYENNKDNLIEQAVKQDIERIENEEGWYEYIKWNFGKDYVSKLVKEGNATIDVEGIAGYIRVNDGRGGELACYDGMEWEWDDYYIYKQDDAVYCRTENEFVEDIDEKEIM